MGHLKTNLFLEVIGRFLCYVQVGDLTEHCVVDGQSHGRQALQVDKLHHGSLLKMIRRGTG